MHFNPEFMWHCFNTNPIPYNLRKGSRLLIPPAKPVNFGTNSITFRGSLLWNNLPLRLKNSQTIDDFKFELKNLGKIHCTCTVSLVNVFSFIFIHYRYLDGYFWFLFLTYCNIYLYLALQETPSSYKEIL